VTAAVLFLFGLKTFNTLELLSVLFSIMVFLL